MKAVILAAGKGTRLLPLTEDKPKVLIEINGKPFLWYVLNLFKKLGIDEIAVIVGYKKEKIKEFIAKYGFDVTLVEQKEQKGTGHATLQAKEFVGNDNFIVYHGDGLWSKKDLQKFMVEDDLTYMAGKQVENWQRYGILLEEKGFLKEKVEKPQKFIGDLAWVGFFKTTPEIFAELEKVKLSPRGEIEVTDAINVLARQKKVKIISLEDYWLDLGTHEDIPKIEKFIKEHPEHFS